MSFYRDSVFAVTLRSTADFTRLLFCELSWRFSELIWRFSEVLYYSAAEASKPSKVAECWSSRARILSASDTFGLVG